MSRQLPCHYATRIGIGRSVVGTSVRCIYPSVSKNLMRALLDYVIVLFSNEADESQEVALMWSSTSLLKAHLQWNPAARALTILCLLSKSMQEHCSGGPANSKSLPFATRKPRQLSIANFLRGRQGELVN